MPIQDHDVPTAPRVYTPHELAEMLRISRNSVYEALRTKQIPSIRVGRKYLIPTRALEHFLSIDDEDDAGPLDLSTAKKRSDPRQWETSSPLTIDAGQKSANVA